MLNVVKMLAHYDTHNCEENVDFDRSFCPEPCNTMHYYCTVCNKLIDECAHVQEV